MPHKPGLDIARPESLPVDMRQDAAAYGGDWRARAARRRLIERIAGEMPPRMA